MPLEHAIVHNEDTNVDFEVLFNPAEYSLSKDNVFAQAAIPGRGAPLLQWASGNARTLDMELFFDTLERHVHVGSEINPAQGDVLELTSKVVQLMEVNPATHAPVTGSGRRT